MSIQARAASILRPPAVMRQIGPIGLDVALESLHLVQLEKTGGSPAEIRACVSLPLDFSREDFLERPQLFQNLIKRALASDRFFGRDVVLALPSNRFRTVSINYRVTNADKDDAAAILKVMSNRLDGNLQDYVLDYMPVKSRSNADERIALVAVSERQCVVDILESVRKAGLAVAALEIGPVSIGRLIGAMSADNSAANILVINSGRRASYLTLISGGDLLFDQEVGVGENSLIDQICDSLDMTREMARDLVARSGVHPKAANDSLIGSDGDTELFDTLAEILRPQFLKLVDEIKRTFLYAASETRGGAVTQVYLLGSIARWPGAATLLSALTAVDVAKIPDPLALFPSRNASMSSRETHSVPDMAVATGLALRGLTEHG